METKINEAKNRLDELKEMRRSINEEIKANAKIVGEELFKIFDPRMAKRLLKAGNPIVDILPNKFRRSAGKTVFVFKNDEKFKKDFEELKENANEYKSNKNN